MLTLNNYYDIINIVMRNKKQMLNSVCDSGIVISIIMVYHRDWEAQSIFLIFFRRLICLVLLFKESRSRRDSLLSFF